MSSHAPILGPRAPQPTAGSSTVGSPGVGFEIASGEPDELQSLAGALSGAGESLRSHGQIIQTAVERAGPAWHGAAGEDYGEVLERLAAQFHSAAETAGNASSAFIRWAAELRRCRREGLLAVSEAEHWLAQISSQTRLLAAAERDISSLSAPHRASSADNVQALDHAHTQARGRQAWEDAEAAAEHATSAVAPLLAAGAPAPSAAPRRPKPLT
jgi:uncharacterized protein YukE